MKVLEYKYISNLITRILLSLIFVMLILIINKLNPKFYSYVKKYTFDKSLNFIKFNNLSKKIIGKKVFYTDKINENQMGVNKALDFKNNSTKYFDGEKFKVSKNLPIGAISSGVIIYIGNKENFNNTIIIQGNDNYNIWYGNIENINYSLYEYVEKGSLIGSSISDEVYLLIEKDGKLYTYDEYKKITNN